jgi:cell division initiation protein
MIDLTPLEVRQKKGDFRRAFRGYDPELVNDFLDLVADRMEELVRENLALREGAASTENEIASYRQKEQALSDALMTAQKLREDARQHAEQEGKLLLREAQLQAQSLRDEAARQLVREQEALRHVRARRVQLVESFRRLLDREVAELDIIEETLELGGDPGAGQPSPAQRHPEPQPALEVAEVEVAEVGVAEVEVAEVEVAEVEVAEVEVPELELGGTAEEEPEDEDDDEDWLSSLIEEERRE